MKLQTVISAKATFACFGNPYKQGSFVISGGFQFIDTYLASRAGGLRVRGVTNTQIDDWGWMKHRLVQKSDAES